MMNRSISSVLYNQAKMMGIALMMCLLWLHVSAQEQPKELSVGMQCMPGISTLTRHYFVPPSVSRRVSVSGGLSVKKEVKKGSLYLKSGDLVIMNDMRYPVKRVVFDVQAHAGLIKNIGEIWSFQGGLFISPVFNYNLNNYGIDLGVSYKLNKAVNAEAFTKPDQEQ